MKKLIFKLSVFLILVLVASSALAWDGIYTPRPYRDHWGNHYRHYGNMWKDSDRDGIINYFDYNDRNPYIQNPYQKNYYENGWHKHRKIDRYYGW